METPRLDASIEQSQKALFLYNRVVPLDAASYEKLLAAEAPWIERLLATFEQRAEAVSSIKEFEQRLDALVDEDARHPPASCLFLAQAADRAQFKHIVDQFAVDALTEAQAFFPILPRLPIEAQMPLMRVLIDEFGCGNLGQMHTYLYVQLLRELGSPTDVAHFVDIARDEVFAFVNVFHWMTKRAPEVEYFLGALAWFESVVPSFFAHYVKACARLHINAHHYFTEHVHIDSYHARSALLAIHETARHRPIDCGNLWVGALVAHHVTGAAFDKVVDIAAKQIAA